jgi:chromosome segregation ATPase
MAYKIERLTQFADMNRKQGEETKMNNEDIEHMRTRLAELGSTLSPESQQELITLFEDAVNYKAAVTLSETIASLNDAVVEAQTRAEAAENRVADVLEYIQDLEGQYEHLVQGLDEYLEEWAQDIREDLDSRDQNLCKLIEATANVLGVSADEILQQAETARRNAKSAHSDGSAWNSGVGDDYAARNKASAHGGGARQPTGDLADSPGLRESLDVDPSVAGYVNYMDAVYARRMIKGGFG